MWPEGDRQEVVDRRQGVESSRQQAGGRGQGIGRQVEAAWSSSLLGQVSSSALTTTQICLMEY